MIYYLIVGLTIVTSLVVNIILKSVFSKYSKIYLKNNMNGKEIAEKMLLDNNIYDVNVYSIEGELTDHYNPLNKTINLSNNVYYENNIAAAAVAAHECGHALQHKLGYDLLNIRNKLIPVVNISSKLSNLVITTGLAIFYSSDGENTFILKLGIFLFSLAVLFSIITLPIEFDASKKALLWLSKKNIVSNKEYSGVKISLNWAAMTYVVSSLGAIFQLLYFIYVLNNKKE